MIAVRLEGPLHDESKPDDRPARLTLGGSEQAPLPSALHCIPGKENCGGGSLHGRIGWLECCGWIAMRGDEQRHHGGRRPASEAPARDQARRNMATPQRIAALGVLAYGALALAMLTMSGRPIDAKGRPDPHRATAMSREPPDSGRENDRSRAAEHGRGRQATSHGGFPGGAGRTSSGALTRR